jgi:hypothetical protein
MTFFWSARGSRSWSRAILFVAGAGSAAACTLFNPFAELKPAPPDAGDDALAPVDTGPGDSGGGDTSPPGDGPIDGTDGGGEAGFPDKGVIVVSGRVSDDAGVLQGVLTALDPTTGMELPHARETLNAPIVLYDGKRDLWFVIESQGTSLFPTPTDRAVLHIRTLDPVSGTWTTLQSLQVPPPVFGLATALTNRLLYVGFDNLVDSQSGTSLLTIDTADPSAPNIYDATPLPVQPFGMIGTRSDTGNGGPANMLLSLPCPDDGGAPADAAPGDAAPGGEGGAEGGVGTSPGRCLTVQHVTVPPAPDPATLKLAVPMGPFFGKPAYGSYLTGGPLDVIGWSLPGSSPGFPGSTAINLYQPQNEVAVGSAIPIQTSDGFFQPFAFAECQHQALLTATNEDLAVYAIPLSSANAMIARAPTTHSGQSVYFEPYTSTVLAPFTQGDGFVLTAFTLGGTQSNPTLTPRQTGWTPPPDVRPEVLAVRAPVPPRCPP